jgi:hypothetical protein
VERRRASARVYAVIALLEDRAAGRKRWRGAGAALTWYARTREAWSTPKALTMRDEGTGAPSRGAESPARRLFAAVVGALREAERDDRKRHPERPAPLQAWVLAHFGVGRSFAFISEATERRGVPEWTEVEIEGRVRRLCRVVRDHLRAGRWLDEPGGRDEA